MDKVNPPETIGSISGSSNENKGTVINMAVTSETEDEQAQNDTTDSGKVLEELKNQSATEAKSKTESVFELKKRQAQQLMDIALLTANASQLRYVLQSNGSDIYFYVSITLIGLSILLQIAVSAELTWKACYNGNCKESDTVGKLSVFGVYLIIVVNIFILAFHEFPEKHGKEK